MADPFLFGYGAASGNDPLSKLPMRMPWDWSMEIRPEHREQALRLYEEDPQLQEYVNSVAAVMSRRPVIRPEMLDDGTAGLGVFQGDQPITVEDYIRGKSAPLVSAYQQLGYQVDPEALVQDVRNHLVGRGDPNNVIAREYANDVLNTLKRGALLEQGPADRSITSDEYADAYRNTRLSPDDAVPQRMAPNLEAQAIYDYLRAMQDGEHAPPYANMMSQATAAIGAPFDWSGQSANQFASMGFDNPIAGRAKVANYWLQQHDATNRGNAAPSLRESSGTGPFPGRDAIYPAMSSTTASGALGAGNLPGAIRGSDHWFGRHQTPLYRFWADFSRNPVAGTVAPGATHGQGAAFRTGTDLEMDYFINRPTPIVPRGMTAEQLEEFAAGRAGDEAKGESWAAATYPLAQAQFGVPPEQRTWGPNWYTTAVKSPQNILGDVSTPLFGMAGAAVGAAKGGALAGLNSNSLSQMGRQVAKGAGQGFRAGSWAAASDMMTDPPVDYLVENSLGYATSEKPSFLSHLMDSPKQVELMPDASPGDVTPETLRQSSAQRDTEYSQMQDEWNAARGRQPKKAEPLLFRDTRVPAFF